MKNEFQKRNCTPAQLAALEAGRVRAPAFAPGISGNPGGRSTGYKSLIGWQQTFSTLTEAELKRIAEDREETAYRRIAARQLIFALHCEDAYQTIVDNDTGRPKARIELPAMDTRPVADRAAELLAEIRAGFGNLREPAETSGSDLV